MNRVEIFFKNYGEGKFTQRQNALKQEQHVLRGLLCGLHLWHTLHAHIPMQGEHHKQWQNYLENLRKEVDFSLAIPRKPDFSSGMWSVDLSDRSTPTSELQAFTDILNGSRQFEPYLVRKLGLPDALAAQQKPVFNSGYYDAPFGGSYAPAFEPYDLGGYTPK